MKGYLCEEKGLRVDLKLIQQAFLLVSHQSSQWSGIEGEKATQIIPIDLF